MSSIEQEIISFCYIKKTVIESEYYGESDQERYCLLRIADFTNGEYYPLEETKFSNHRSTLYFNDWPKDDSDYGLWKWSATPHYKGGGNEYIKSRYVVYKSIYPKEIISIDGITSYDDLLKYLLSKDNYITPIFDDFLLAYEDSNTYYAFYIQKNNYTKMEKSIVLNSNIYSLPQYQIHKNEVFWFEFDNKISKCFYRKAIMDSCEKKYLLRDINEIIYQKIKGKCEWRYVHSNLALTKNEWHILQKYLESLSTDDFYKEIASELHVDLEEAKADVLKCIKGLDGYFEKDNGEAEIFKELIINNPFFMKNYEKEFKKQLEGEITEEEEYLKELDQERETLNNKISVTNNEYIKLTRNIGKLKDEKQEIELEINNSYQDLHKIEEQKERAKKFGESIEEEIRTKITQAQNEATKFIANNIWLNLLNQKSLDETSNQTKNEDQQDSDQNLKKFIKEGKKTIKTSQVKDYYEQFEIFMDNLNSMGLDSVEGEIFAIYLYSAYITHNNVLLVGPYGYEIASALSAAIDSQYASRIVCNSRTVDHIDELINECESEVVVIDGMIANNFEGNIASMLQTDKFLIFTHPYKDDLMLEPFGLFNYLTPIFSDYFIENKIVINEIFGAVKNPNFSEYQTSYSNVSVGKHKKYWKFNKMIELRNAEIINACTDIEGNTDPQYEFECCYMPFAYISNQKKQFVEECEKNVGIHYKKIKHYMEIEDE